jgi:hypothetical protein
VGGHGFGSDAATSPRDAATPDAVVFDSGHWMDLTSASDPAPSARAYHAMALDEARGRVVLFGGSTDTGIVGDTWEWDIASRHWLERTPPLGVPQPGPRRSHAMVYDGRNVLLFSGGDYPPYQYDDLWRWDGDRGRWFEVAPQSSTRPPPRYDHAMAFDPETRRVLLYGGRAFDGTYLNDAFEWRVDTEVWVDRAAQVGSPRVCRHALAFDPSSHSIVLFGGMYFAASDQLTYRPDLWQWSWSSSRWTSRAPSPLPSDWPEGRIWTGLAYDDSRRRLLLIDGLNLRGTGDADRWDWDGAARTWSRLARTPSPAPRAAHTVVSIGGVPLGRVLLFGGYFGSAYLGDTWLWDGAGP